MNTIRQSLLAIVLILSSCGIQKQIFASHLSGGEITFVCISGNNYEVYLTLYRDCSGIPLGTFHTVQVCGPATPSSINLTVVPRPIGTPGDSEGFEDITPLCGGSSLCVGGTATVGYSKAVLKGNFTVTGTPSLTNPIVLSYNTCCRNTLTNSSCSGFYIDTRIYYHVMGGCNNNSPTFLANQTGFACLSQPFVYNNTAFDPDGDELRYYLVTPWENPPSPCNGTPGSCTYNTPYTQAVPIASSLAPCGVAVDSLNGSLSFIPSQVGRYIFAVEVREYRTLPVIGRVHLSTVRRDIQLFVTNCPGSGGSPPTITVTRGSTVTNIPVTVSCTPLPVQETTVSTCELMQLQIDVEASGSLPLGTSLIFKLAGDFFDVPVNPSNAYCANPLLNRACATISATYPGSYVHNQGLVATSPPYKAGCLISWTPKQGDVGSKVIYISVEYCSSIGSIPFKFTVPYRINVQPNPITAIFASGGCAGGVTVLQAVGTGGSLTPYYSWSFDDGLTFSTPSSSPTISHVFPSVGTYEVIIRVQDGPTGQVCSQVKVTVNIVEFIPEPILSTVNPPKVCTGGSITYAVPASSYKPGWEYTLSFGDGSPDTTFSYLNGVSSVTHIYASPGTYVLNYTVKNDAGCVATVSQFVTVLPPVDANIAVQKDTVCEGSPVFIGNNSVHADTYEWRFFDNTTSLQVLPTRTDTTEASFSVTFPGPGQYMIRLTALNELSCADIETKIITVLPLPEANVSLSDTVVCIGESVQFNTTNTGNYAWDFSETGISTPLYNVPNPVRVFTTPGVYTIGFTAYGSVNSCTKTIYRKVRVLEKPNPDFSATDTVFCVGEPIRFKNLTTMNNNGQAISYYWTFGDGGTSTVKSPTYVYNSPGTYTVYLEASTSYGGKTCTYRDSLRVTAIPKPKIHDIVAVPDSAEATPFQTVNFTPIYTSPVLPNTFVWTFGDNTGSSNEENPSHIYIDAGLYPVQLVLTNANGCRDTFVFQMRVIDTDSLWIPNIVTPNNDGKNDVFKVKYKQLKSYHIEIYNRWGNKVYESNDPSQVWDPIKEQDGVYYYVVIAEGRFGTNYNKKGNITVMR
ncbi:MAG: PKD domain-containing protein [Bacteroidia bacterium]|nr:PKD domain-containing protein [Bacteroidia bacterium]